MRKNANAPAKSKESERIVLPQGENPNDKPKVVAPEGELSNKTIESRVRVGKTFLNKFSSLDKAVCETFRDATGSDIYPDAERYIDEDENILDEQPVGVTNQFQINVLGLSAAICINHPDFFVRSDIPNGTDIVRKDLRKQWVRRNYGRRSRAVFQKRCIGGLGCLAYRWDDDKRTVFELVHSWDMIADPCTTDWNDLLYAGRTIRMSMRKAVQIYDPDGTKNIFADKLEEADAKDDTAATDRLKVQLQVYWDKDTEAVLYGGKVIHREKNRYEEVPMIFIEGDIDPGPTAFPIGLGVLTSGPQQQITELDESITNTAKHGGPLNVVDTTLLTKELQEAWTDGQQEGLLGVKGMPEKAFARIPGEQLPESVLVARQQAKRDIHSLMGTNETMFGQHIEGANKATEVAQIAQNSGARYVQARRDYETFVDRMAEVIVRLEAEFGGARLKNGRMYVNEEVRDLQKAYKSVREIHVIESSTVYRDPAQDQQQTMQLMAATEKEVQLMLTLGMPAPMALVLLLKMKMDELRAFGRTNLDEYMPGCQQFVQLISQTYIPSLAQGQLPPAPDHSGGMKPLSVSASIEKLPPEAQQALLTKAGLLQPGQPMTPAGGEQGQGEDRAAETAHAQLQMEQMKSENAERDRVAKMAMQEAEHRHEATLQEEKFMHDARMSHLSARHKLLAPPPSRNGRNGK